MTIGIIGYGHWGKHVLRNFMQNPNCIVKIVADHHPEKLDNIRFLYSSIGTTIHTNVVLNDSAIDAVALVTPASTHYELAKQALVAGKHVFVEKPFTTNIAQAQELVALAEKKALVIMIDHTYMYSPAWQKIRGMVAQQTLGQLLYMEASRENTGRVLEDVNVLWDLAPHDISLLCSLVSAFPIKIVAKAGKQQYQTEATAAITLYYANNFIATLTYSWVSAIKVRKIQIRGTKGTLLYDDIEPIEKIKMLEADHTWKNIPINNHQEPLACIANAFVEAIENGVVPISNGKMGLTVVKILTAAEMSLKKNSQIVEIIG